MRNEIYVSTPDITFTEQVGFLPSSAHGETVLKHSPFGAYVKEGSEIKETFDDVVANLNESYATKGIDLKGDIKAFVKDKPVMNSFKNDLTNSVYKGFRYEHSGDPHIEHVIDTVETYWDNKVAMFESTAIADFLPISAIEFPIMLKQFFATITKDIIEVEAVKKPEIVKHIRHTFMVDNQTGEEYEYPKCLWDGTWQKIFEAGKGHAIDNTTVVPVPCQRYDIIDALTDGTPGDDKVSWNCKIDAIDVAGTRIELNGNGITVDLSTGGSFVNGNLEFTDPVTNTVVDDVVSGRIDFTAGTVSLSTCAGQITGVYFSGYLSNENNRRSTSVKERRSQMRFRIGDGTRWNMPFSLEEIDDAAAMLDINYYNRMIDEITKCQDVQESMTIMKFFNTQFDKYNGVETDSNKLESSANTYYADIAPPTGYSGNPFEYYSMKLQHRMKAALQQVANEVKLENLSWVVAGNPLATSVMTGFTTWKQQAGGTIGGIKVNGSYGFLTDLGASVRVVASNLYDAYTSTADVETNDRELILHAYAYPGDKEHITFRHLKYNDHLLTSEGQSAFQSPNAGSGGAYKIITSTSRFETIAIQGIQFRMVIRNSRLIYDDPGSYNEIVGSPWDALPAGV